MNEAIQNFTNGKEDITTPWGREFAEEILEFIREKLKEYNNEIMKNEIEFDCTDIENFIDYVYMTHGDEEFVNIVSEIKFWK